MFHVKILYRYIAREYLFSFAAVFGLCALLMGLNIYFEKFEDIAKYSPPPSDVILFVLYGVPGQIIRLMPQIALLAVLFGIGLMSRNNEVLAMHACGVSYTRLGFPVMVCAALISLGAMLVAELVLPQCAQNQAIVDARIRQKNLEDDKNQYEPTGKWVYLTDEFNVAKMTMRRPRILYLGTNGETAHWELTAEKATRVAQGKDGDVWQFQNASKWNFNLQTGRPMGNAVIRPSMKVTLNKNLDRLLGPEKKPAQMNFAELSEHIRVLRENGENPFKYETDLQKKLAFPFSAFILTLIGYTIAVRAHARPLVVGFSYGLAAGIIYFIIDALFSKFGHEGVLSSLTAAWVPNAAFLLFAAYRLRYVNQVRG